jgi:hypothetical protein
VPAAVEVDGAEVVGVGVGVADTDVGAVVCGAEDAVVLGADVVGGAELFVRLSGVYPSWAMKRVTAVPGAAATPAGSMPATSPGARL